MKTLASLIISALLISPLIAQTLRPVELPLVASAEGKVMPIPQDGEIALGAPLIKRLEIGKDSAIISYFNRTATALKPDFEVRIFNGYGMQIGSFGKHWLLDTVAPGSAEKENVNFAIADLSPVFSYTGIKLPADWNKPAFVIVAGKVF